MHQVQTDWQQHSSTVVQPTNRVGTLGYDLV